MNSSDRKEQARLRALKYSRSVHGMAKLLEYRKSLAGSLTRARACRKNYSTRSFKAKAKKQYLKRWDNPQTRIKIQAGNYLRAAIYWGKIIRPDTCEECGCQCKPQAHHQSYLRPDWLKVNWLCRRCHQAIHGTKPPQGFDKHFPVVIAEKSRCLKPSTNRHYMGRPCQRFLPCPFHL